MPSHGTLTPPAASLSAVRADEQTTEADPFRARPIEADPFRAWPKVADPFGTAPTDPAGPAEPSGPGDPSWPDDPIRPGDPAGPGDPSEPRPTPPAVRDVAPPAEEAGTAPSPDQVREIWADAENPDEADWDGDDAGTTFVGFEDGESEDELSDLQYDLNEPGDEDDLDG